MSVKLPPIPTPPASADPALRTWMNAVKSVLDNLGTAASPVLNANNLTQYSSQIAAAAVGDSSPPPKLSGLTAVGGFSFVMLFWDKIPYGNQAYTKIYRSAEDNPETAVAIGTSRTLVYADYVPNSGVWYYWIKSVSNAGVEGPLNQVAGTPGQASTDETYLLEVLDGKLGEEAVQRIFRAQAIGADVIGVNQLAAISADMGTITAGLIQSADQTFNIDLEDKQILITGPNGRASDDYTLLRNGQFEAWKWTSAGHIQYKALTMLENGVANNGNVITLAGYYDEQPGIVVSPANIGAYKASYSAQNQNLVCEAVNVTEFAPGRYQFKARASLSLEAGAFSTTIGYNSGNVNVSALNTGTYTTPANCNQLTLYLQFTSYRGTGTAPNYYYRRVRLVLYYKPAGSASWIFAKDQNYYPGATLGANNGTLQYNFWQEGTYDYYVRAEYYDYSGTFTSGSGGYEYNQQLVSGQNQSVSLDIYGVSGGKSTTLTATLQSYSPPTGWAVYQVTYSASVSGSVEAYGFTRDYPYLRCYGYASALTALGGVRAQSSSTPDSNSFNKNWTTTETSYNPDRISGSVSVSRTGDCNVYSTYGRASGSITNAQATIYIRKPITNSETPVNALNIGTVNYNLSSGLVLAEGTMNWLAIGR